MFRFWDTFSPLRLAQYGGVSYSAIPINSAVNLFSFHSGFLHFHYYGLKLDSFKCSCKFVTISVFKEFVFSCWYCPRHHPAAQRSILNIILRFPAFLADFVLYLLSHLWTRSIIRTFTGFVFSSCCNVVFTLCRRHGKGIGWENPGGSTRPQRKSPGGSRSYADPPGTPVRGGIPPGWVFPAG